MKSGYEFDAVDPFTADSLEDTEEINELRDDLESTKQLLELEVRSKKLLERDNKRMQSEMEKLKAEYQKLLHTQAASGGDQPEEQALTNGEGTSSAPDPVTPKPARRSSLMDKRQSMSRLISESESTNNVPAALAAAAAATVNGEAVSPGPPSSLTPAPPPAEEEEEQLETIEDLQEEVDEARKLAEEWELKYKELQRNMAELDMARRTAGPAGAEVIVAGGKRMSVVDLPPGLERMASTTSSIMDLEPPPAFEEGDDQETWMLRREIHQLKTKIKNIFDKREMVFRERRMLTERVDSIVKSIGEEMEARKLVKAELKEMNEAFKEEIAEMEAAERTARELEECYFSDEEDLVVNKESIRRKSSQEDDDDEYYEEEDVEETLDDIIKLAEGDDGEEDPGHDLFEHYPESDDEEDPAAGGDDDDYEQQMERLNERIERHSEHLATMRKSNFLLKSKIDRLFDILQMQREKHHDLNQELTRMLADIQ